MSIDLRAALNALSDVFMNRPAPLREFDQIYMKLGDLTVHAEFLARRFKDQSVIFVGDGDAVGLSIAHLLNEKIVEAGPTQITILDFDERLVNSVLRFAADYSMESRITAQLYNVVRALPPALVGAFDTFHINPPWGQHNSGESVLVFLERAVQLIHIGGLGVIVIADDRSLPWANDVLQRTQERALEVGMVVEQMIPALHSYHLDDAPDLRSCTLILRKVREDGLSNDDLPKQRLENFYGRNQPLRVEFVRERPGFGRGMADDRSYHLEKLEEQRK